MKKPARIPAAKRRLVIDEIALTLRKPRAGPLVDPDEAIAIALSMVSAPTGRILSPDGPAVRLVLQALKQAGWKIVAA